MRSLPVFLIASSVLLSSACSSNPEGQKLEEFIIGKWQGVTHSTDDPPKEVTDKPPRIEFFDSGKILWDKTTNNRTLRFAGNYTFVDSDTIKVDFIRYSNGSALWDITCSHPSPSRDSITIRDCNADHLIATLERVY